MLALANPFLLLFALPSRFGVFICFLVLAIFVGFGVDVCTSLLICVVRCGGGGGGGGTHVAAAQATGRDCRPPALFDDPLRR